MTNGAALSAFANWVATAARLEETGRREARLSFLDTLGCIASGARTGTAQKVLPAARAAGGGGPARAFGAGGLAPAPAAFFYGACAHAEDFDDSELIGSTHPSAVLVAALLALGQAHDAVYADLLDAYAAGLAAIVHVGGALGYMHYQRGWHATATIGPIGAACACARLASLDTEPMAAALSIASSRAAGSKLQFGTETKAAHVGFAAQAGLEAALLAAAGTSASPTIWDAPGGLLALYGDEAAPGFPPPPEGSLALQPGLLARKAFPCCAYAHRAIAAALSLDVPAQEITSGVVSIPEPFAQVVANPAPAIASEARFSVLYCVAASLIDRRVDSMSFTRIALARADLRALVSKLRLDAYSVPATIDDLSPGYPDRVTLHLKDGRTLEAERSAPPGGPGAPLSCEPLLSKALGCFKAGGLPECAAQRLASTIIDGPCEARLADILAATTSSPGWTA